MMVTTRNSGTARDEWARKAASNIRLAWILGGVAVAFFLMALWKFRQA